MKILKDLAVSGSITVGEFLQSSINTDKFLVSENGVVKYRSGSQLLGDIGAAASDHTHTFASLTSKPTTVSGYGITDAVNSATTITINGTTYDLSANRSWTITASETDTLATVTGRGASTSTASIFSSSLAVGHSSHYDSAQFSLDINGGLLVKNTGKTAQLILINANPAIGGNAGFVQHAVGGTINGAFASIQTYYGASIAAGTLQLQPSGGIVTIGGSTVFHAGNYTTYSPTLTGSGASGTWSINITGSAGSVAWANVTGKPTALSSFTNDLGNYGGWITGYTETDTLATVTGRGANTTASISAANFQNAYQVLSLNNIKTPGLYNYDGGITGTQPLGTEWYNVRTIEVGADSRYSQFVMPYSADRIFYRRKSDAGFAAYVELYHTGNLPTIPTNNNQLTNGAGYITGYTETDTLNSVTSRGASTANNITLSGAGNLFNGHHYFSPHDANGNHYPHYNAGSSANGSKLNLRMFDNSNNVVLFHLNGSSKAIEWNGNTIWHAGNLTNLNQLTNGPGYITSSALTPYLPLAGGTMTGNLYIQSGGNPTQFNLRGTNPELYVDAAYGGGTARLIINRASTSNQATLHFTTGTTVTNGTAWNFSGAPLWTMGMTNSSQTSDFKLAYGDIYDANAVAFRIDTNRIAYFTNTPYVGANIIATQSWVASQGYSTSSGSFLPLSGGTLTGNLQINPVSASWAEGLAFYMPTSSLWGGIRFQRGRSGYDGNWAIGYTALDATDDIVFVANNGGAQVNNILRLTKAGAVSTMGNALIHAGNIGSQSVSSAATVTGSSTINGYLTLNVNWGASPYTSAFTIIGTHPSMTFRGSNGDTHYLMHMDSAGDIQYYFGPGYTTNNWTRRYEFSKGGNFTCVTGTISATNFSGSSSGTNTGDQTNISGNAATATNSSQLNGYGFTSYAYRLSGTGYYQVNDWMQFNGNYGLYWPNNYGLHFYPNNDGSYGSAQILGEKNGWRGLHFGGGNGMTLMMNEGEFGFHRQAVGWTARFTSGTGHFNISGNAATATNVAWSGVTSKPSHIMYYQSFTLDANTMDVNATGFTYAVNAPHTGPIVRFSAGGAYDMWLNAPYHGGGNALSFRTRNGDTATLNPWREIIHTGNIGSQKVDGAMKLWAESHPSDYYVRVNWTGTHWFITSNHPSPVRVGYADSAGSAPANGGTSSNTNSISNALGNTHDWTNINYFVTNNGGQSVNNSSSARLQAYSSGNNSAFMSFHKGGHFAVNFGLDDDNVMRIGGWSAGANRWQLDMSGNMTVAGDVTAYSDVRVKTNIKTIENALDKVLGLRGVSYTRTDSEDVKTKIGVIAQETLPIVPEVVNQDNDGMYNVSYGNFGGLFIEAIKAQQLQIEDLKKQIEYLVENK
jgi:hypothetical protein